MQRDTKRLLSSGCHSSRRRSSHTLPLIETLDLSTIFFPSSRACVRLCVLECLQHTVAQKYTQSCSPIRRIFFYMGLLLLLGKTFSAVGVNYSSYVCWSGA